jgi:hypothetical protein
MDKDFLKQVAQLIEQARSHVGRTANVVTCITYYEVGRMIVEKEQQGEKRAQYGKGLMKELADYLTKRFGRGFSLSNIKNARQFYTIYSKKLQHEVSKSQLTTGESALSALTEKSQLLTGFFKLSWTHYVVLIRIKNDAERNFYEIEAAQEQWNVKQLQRQYNSSLYERLALSRNKDEVMRLANEGQVIEKPQDMLKSPLVLEFLGLKESPAYSETDNVVELTLPENANIYASEYNLYLPDKTLLQEKLQEWADEYETYKQQQKEPL